MTGQAAPAEPGGRAWPGARAQDAWGTWDAAWPGCLAHPASGACVRIGAYSASEGTYTGFRWSADHRLGAHHPGGGLVEAGLRHAGTTLRLRAVTSQDTVLGELARTAAGEWGLRFWIVIEFGPWDAAAPAGRPGAGQAARLIAAPGGAAYAEAPEAVIEAGGMAAAFATLDRPADARLAARPGAIGEAMEEAGYYARPAAPRDGRIAVFRFTTADPVIVFAAAAGPDQAAARQAAARTLAARSRLLPPEPAAGPAREPAAPSAREPAAPSARERAAPSAPEPAASAAQPSPEPAASAAQPSPEPGGPVAAREAIRDVLGWNTVWDPVHRRPYTVSTRAWIEPKFGGFCIWQTDGFLHAVLAAHLGESWLAWANIDAVLSSRARRGNLVALASGSSYWQDRSHPPFGSHVCWSVQAMTPDSEQRRRAAEILLTAFDWWFRARDGNRNGLLEYGSSPVGDGHFVHTKQAAMDESANDNSPVHDEARFDLAAHTLDLEDVGLNSLLVHEGQMLARMLEADGRGEAARRVGQRAAALAGAVRERLWDPRRGVFAGRHWDGRFTASLAPTSFYPMLAGIATREQAETMVAGWLASEERFGGQWPVAGTPHEDPAAGEEVYWRGRVWPCFNYAVYLGLRRYRFDAEATWLARRGLEMFARGWAGRRCYENFSQRTGEGGGPDCEPFYTWGALLPFLADADLISVDPWDGVTFGRDGSDAGSASTCIGGLVHEVTLTAGSTTLSRGQAVLLAADLRGRFRHLEVSPGGLSVEIPPAGREVTIEVTLDPPAASVRLDAVPVPGAGPARAGEPAVVARIGPSRSARRLECGP